MRIRTFTFLIVICTFAFIQPQSRVLDNFEKPDGWTSYSSEGVEIKASLALGKHGNAIRIDYNFVNGAGYGGIQKMIPLTLPKGFKFSFYVKGDSPNNNLEFKLLDSSKQNVWWVNKRDYTFSSDWKNIRYGQRDISFAWGPTEDKSLNKIAFIEFTISSYNGGKGSVYIDELCLSVNEEKSLAEVYPKIYLENAQGDEQIHILDDHDNATFWMSNDNGAQSLLIDLSASVEFGGLLIDWYEGYYAIEYEVFISSDRKHWESVYVVSTGKRGRSWLRLPETESRYIRIRLKTSADKSHFAINEIKLLPPEYSTTLNTFFINRAKDYPRGHFPRYFSEEASSWTVTGLPRETKEAMINSDGMVEVDKGSFSIEPFIYSDNEFITWSDVETTQQLEENYLPIPSVKWKTDSLELETKTFSAGEAFVSTTQYLLYTIRNTSSSQQKGSFYAAVRPFQVNPYYQFLNFTGGVSAIRSVKYADKHLKVDSLTVNTITPPDNFGAASYDEGSITEFLAQNTLPLHKEVTDRQKLCSGALEYRFDLKPGEEKLIILSIPYYKSAASAADAVSAKSVETELNAVRKFWKEKTNEISFKVPPEAQKLADVYRSMIAYILINADNDGTQPGSRSYERSWIRDGALTCSALLRAGLTHEVHNYIAWYSKYLFPSGKVPCVVDKRGADPVPENDSNGEYLFLLNQYLKFTGDTALISQKYGTVNAAVNYLQQLMEEGSKEMYHEGNDSLRSLYGLLPESISHEGYSAKPMHSYWDDFFALRGLNDAVQIASTLGRNADAHLYAKMARIFQTNLYNSINSTIARTHISYVPGCADLGDFDATSTAIALYPCGQLNNLPAPYGRNTFEQYYQYFTDRESNKIKWVNYTPYEVRLIGAFVQLGEREKAQNLTRFFLKNQKPLNWNHWAEVVWSDEKFPGFIGDMPHTWVGSDFMNSMRMMFLYERDYDTSLVLMAGIPYEWFTSNDGIGITNAPTAYGKISYSAKIEAGHYIIDLSGNIKLPAGGIVLDFPYGELRPTKIKINDTVQGYIAGTPVKVTTFPAKIEIY